MCITSLVPSNSTRSISKDHLWHHITADTSQLAHNIRSLSVFGPCSLLMRFLMADVSVERQSFRPTTGPKSGTENIMITGLRIPHMANYRVLLHDRMAISCIGNHRGGWLLRCSAPILRRMPRTRYGLRRGLLTFNQLT